MSPRRSNSCFKLTRNDLAANYNKSDKCDLESTNGVLTWGTLLDHSRTLAEKCVSSCPYLEAL